MVFLPNRKFNKVAHLADIHIRLFKRHAEYKRVFENLYEQLRNENTSDDLIICVAGDILHSKTDMSPESISLVSEFFTTLGKIAPVVVIPGNHDMNLANPHRMDSLSPIITNLSDNNVMYFLRSGVYTVGNVDFAVFSIVGDRTDWPTIYDCSSEHKIALYHGPVYSAVTDAGYTITDRHVDVSVFEQFPITMLGDIHRFQQLPTAQGIAIYPGSLIQQNHGESYSGHGWVLWDLNEKTYQHIETKNDYGYVTLRISDKEPLHIPELPGNVRLRLVLDGVDSNGIRQIVSLIKEKVNVVELSVTQMANTVSSVSGPVGFDPNDVNAQNTWIREFISKNMESVSEETIETIVDINKKFNLKIQEDELPRNIHWKPINLKFDNLFSYGEKNEIDFSVMNGLYGLFSVNASGKSSALEAMSFALYDKTPRAFKGNHIMNTRRNTMYCRLEFMVDQNTYVIERNGSRKKTGDVKVDVDFYQLRNGEKISLNGESRRDTNANIRTYVGTYEDFILTTLSVQNQNSMFIDTGQTERKDLLSQFIGLTLFDRLYTLALDESREIYGLVKFYSKNDYDEELKSAELELNTKSVELIAVEQNILDLTQQKTELEKEIQELYECKRSDVENIDIDPIMEKLTHSEKQLYEIHELLKQQTPVYDSLQNEYSTQSKEFDNKFSSISDEFENYQSAQVIYNQVQREHVSAHKELQSKKDKLDKLAEHKYDPNCEFCMNNIFVKDAIATKKEYQTLLDDFLVLDEELIFAKNRFDNLLYVVDLIKEKDTKIAYLNSLRSRLDKALGTISSHKTKVHDLELKIQEYRQLEKRYHENKTLITENKRLQNKISELEIQKRQLEHSIQSGMESIKTLNGDVLLLKNKIEKINHEQQQLEYHERMYADYELYMRIIGRDGLPYQLISSIIPYLQEETNNILSQMAEFSVLLEIDGKNINGKIVYEDDRTWPLELASGMEKFISGLAIRVALTKISNLPKPNFLIVDEGFGVLDSDNLASMSTMFDVLKNSYEIIILISHLDSMRDLVDNIIEIHRSDGYSKITVV